MNEFLRERPGLVAALFVAAAGIVLFVTLRKPDDAARQREAYTETEPRAEAVKSPRLDEIRKIEYKDSPRALALAEEIIAAPKDPKEKAAAQALLPALVEHVFHQLNQNKQYDEARKYLQRMTTEFPDDFRAAGVRMVWGQTLASQLKEAIRARNAETVETVFLEYRGGGYYLPRRDNRGRQFSGDADVIEEYARFQLARWKQLPPDRRRQDPGLGAAAGAFEVILDHNRAFQLRNELQEPPPVPGEEVFALSQTFDRQGRTAAALSALTLANSILESGRLWQAEPGRDLDYKVRAEMIHANDRRISELAAALAGQLHATPASVLCSMTPDPFLNTVISQIRAPENRAALHELRLRLAVEDYLAETLPLTKYKLQAVAEDTLPYEAKTRLAEQLHEARNQGRRIESDLRRDIFENLTRQTNVNLWSKLPAQTIEEVERAVPTNTPVHYREQARLEAVRRLVAEQRVPNPVETPPAFQERRVRVATLNGVYLLGSSREEAFRDLRTALHESSSPAVKAQVQTAVQTAFRLSQKQGQFGVLVELAGFYGAEFGDQLAGDPFREEFRRALEASAGRFGAGERMKAVFVQALLASAFAGEETGRKAQRETVRRAFEAVASVTPDKDFGAPGPPSGIPGHSTVGVNNSTEHHILLVYDGPEQFAVLCSPLRKGSFTARNGAYRIAVMTPLGDIVPYRAERTLKDEHAMSDYRIQKGGPGADASWNYGATAYGDYTLLRAGDGLGAMLVNPQTGTIKAQ